MSGPMRLPFEPLTITTSPARRAATSGSRKPSDRSAQKARRAGVVASKSARESGPAAKSKSTRAASRSGSERRVQRRALIAELEHVADDRDAPPLGPWLGRAEQRQRCAHRGGVGVVAFVDDDEGAVGAGKLEALAAPLLRREVL